MKRFAKNLLKFAVMLTIITGLTLTLSPNSQAQPPEGTIVVVGVVPNGPAAQAGLQNGDILRQIDGQPLTHPVDLQQYLHTLQPNDTVTLIIERDTQEQTLTVTLGEHYGQPYLGITTVFQPPWFTGGWPPNSGVSITFVTPGGPAEQAGLQPGDVILAVDGEKIVYPYQLVTLITAHTPGDTVTLTVQSIGQSPRDLVVTLNEHPYQPNTAHLGVTIAPHPMPSPYFYPPRGPYYPPCHPPFPQPPYMPTPPPGDDTYFEQKVVIRWVLPASPAEAAGLKPGQTITAINGAEVTTPAAVIDAIAQYAPGDTVTLTVISAGEDTPQTVAVTLGVNPYQPDRPWLGVRLESQTRYQYHYEQQSPGWYHQPPNSTANNI